jgi:lysophospholipase L1-like esterase
MKDRIRIVALGDSTTAGTPGWRSPLEAPPAGAGNEQSQYAYWLMRAHPEWEVLNRGVNGERSDAILARFDRDVIAARPRAVVIIAGVNDVYQGRAVHEIEANLDRMVLPGSRRAHPRRRRDHHSLRHRDT